MHDWLSHPIVLVSSPDSLNHVRDLLERMWADSPQISDVDRTDSGTALIELASTVMHHANHGTQACDVHHIGG